MKYIHKTGKPLVFTDNATFSININIFIYFTI